MRTPFLAAIAFALAAGAAAVGAVGQPAPTPAPAINVSTTVPSDILPDAPSAPLSAAAAFAWNEFFALNWTAKTSGSAGATLRDTPDTACHFGDPSCTTLSRPKVWQTFRGKVEIFPGNGKPPASYVTPPPPTPAATWSYGYDGGPSYVYAARFGKGTATPGPCPNQSPAATPWVNLDETDQITLNSMYAGIAPSPVPSASPGTTNSQPQMIRFVAKANRTMYSYIEGNKLWTAGAGKLPVPNQADPTPAAPPYSGTRPSVISFPNGTIETKSAWRALNGTEAASGRFVMAPVRYYETSNGQFSGTCWRQDTFGLVSLHIIQKTPSAPYFIYATFEQSDNIQNANPGDGPVEDVNGNPAPCPAGAAPPCPVAKLPATTPETVLQDITATPNPPNSAPIPPQINRIINGKPVPPSASVPDGYCPKPGNRLYYLNTAGLNAAPNGGFICINRRDNAIPPAVVAANVAAHAALAAYEAKNGGYHSPFEYYKLINVQSSPYDKQKVGPYVQASGGPLPSTYSLANILVETNRSLQTFSGSLVGGGSTGSNSDFAPLFNRPILGQTFKNVYFNKKVHDMGGCMGCHGTQAQQRGSDFSVIAFQGSVKAPEYPAPIVLGRGAKQIPRNRAMGHSYLSSH